MSVTRYDIPGYDGLLEPSDDGDLVMASDYDTLLEKYNQLRLDVIELYGHTAND